MKVSKHNLSEDEGNFRNWSGELPEVCGTSGEMLCGRLRMLDLATCSEIYDNVWWSYTGFYESFVDLNNLIKNFINIFVTYILLVEGNVPWLLSGWGTICASKTYFWLFPASLRTWRGGYLVAKSRKNPRVSKNHK